MKIAVYSANFGDYRKEISAKKLDNINFSEEIDYYFFTDMDIQSSKWNVQKVTLEKELDFGGKTCPMTKYRHTSKKYKFCLPKILASYDYVIWCDTKSLRNINNLSLNKIEALITNKQKSIYLIQHPHRKNTSQELKATLQRSMEKDSDIKKFREKIQNINFNSVLPDTTTIIRKVNDKYNQIFTQIYNLQLENQLCRDQNIIQYGFYYTGCESELFYFKSQKDLRDKLH